VELGFLELLQGLFSTILVVICIVVGITIMLKYFKFKQRDLLLVGIAYIGITTPWLGDVANLIMILIFDSELDEIWYFLIIIPLLAPFILLWVIAVSDMVFKSKQKEILILYFIAMVIFEIIFFILLLQSTENIGKSVSPFHYEYSLFTQIYFLIYLAFFVITGFLFSRESLKSNNPEIKLKGKFLLIAFILVTIGCILETSYTLTPLIVVIARVILSVSAIAFYFGFILPKFMKKSL
jgi:hypothetical protein